MVEISFADAELNQQSRLARSWGAGNEPGGGDLVSDRIRADAFEQSELGLPPDETRVHDPRGAG